MNFDGLTLNKVVRKIKEFAIGKRIDNIYNPLKSEYDFIIRGKTLLVSVSSNHGRMYFTDNSKENPLQPSNFAMVLRKYIKKSVILNFETLGYDRVVKIDFKGRGELGEERIISLYIELMGKYSNLILVDGNRIIDAHKRIVTRYRKILPNKEYVPFTNDKNVPEFYLKKERFFDQFKECDKFDKCLTMKIQGMSPQIAKIIANKATDLEGLYTNYKRLITDYLNKEGLYFAKHKVYPIPFPNTIYMEDIFTGLQSLYESIEREEINRNKKQKYFVKIEEKIKKITKEIENLNKDLRETDDYDIYRKYGELLQIYQSTIKDRNPSLQDYETGELINVPLIERKNAMQSAIIYFKKYNKLKRRKAILSKRIKHLASLLSEAQDISLHIQIASSNEDLAEVEKEFTNLGIEFKTKKNKKRKKTVRISKPKEYIIDECVLFVGKNSFQNESLYRHSPKNSIWLHAKGLPSSHGILQGNYNERVLKTAAEIIAYHSKARLSSKVQIDYTELSNVWKPKGAAKGFVLYKNFKTITVDPNEHEELLKNKIV